MLLWNVVISEGSQMTVQGGEFDNLVKLIHLKCEQLSTNIQGRKHMNKQTKNYNVK